MTYQEAHETLRQERLMTFYRYPAMNEAVKLALVAIEKQMPKIMLNMRDWHDHSGEFVYTTGDCPTCGTGNNADEYLTPVYCNHCGQRISWRKDE